jgi:hypothetical protein
VQELCLALTTRFVAFPMAHTPVDELIFRLAKKAIVTLKLYKLLTLIFRNIT